MKVAKKPTKADRRLSAEDLSPDQAAVFRGIADWAEDAIGGRSPFRDTDPEMLRVGGLAGSGKSTLLGLFAAETAPSLGAVAYVSYTGRAASVLSRKLKAQGVTTTALSMTTSGKTLAGRFGHLFYGPGSPEALMPYCGTIHRLLYQPIINERTDELIGWRKRQTFDRGYKLIVVDEASMIGDELLQDLKTHDVPILAVGDHGQLPPVASSGSLMEEPDMRLEQIHRQAVGSPIIQFAHHLRGKGRLRDFSTRSKDVIFGDRGRIKAVLEKAYASAKGGVLDVAILCWTNRTRCKLNAAAREVLGHSADDEAIVREGETLICLRNMAPVYNGMRGVVTHEARAVDGQEWIADVGVAFPEDGISSERYEICITQLGREKTYGNVDELKADGLPVETVSAAGSFFDYGYACTVHKFQGSQVPHVIVYVDRPEKTWEEDWRRWIYTAATRAAERLTVLR